jgi:hypothetical protein
MIKKMFDDGCLGVKLYAQEASEKEFKKYLRSVSPLNNEENEILVMQIIAREEDVRVFPQSGYRVGWKRTPTFSFLVVVFCPIQEIQEEGNGVTTSGYL